MSEQPTTTNYALPELLAALRKDAGISQAEMAARLNVSASAVSQLEKLDHPLREDSVLSYAKALGFESELDAIAHGVSLLGKSAPKRATRTPRKRAAPSDAPKAQRKPRKSKHAPAPAEQPATTDDASIDAAAE